MIKTLSLKNFKGFEALQELEIKPVTVLCGTNSSGKSSILQSILLLKQTLESQMPNQLLLLNGRLVHLGPFEEVIFDRESDRRLGFDLKLAYRTDARGVYRQERIPIAYILQELGELIGKANEAFEVRFRVEVKSTRQSVAEAQLKALQVEILEFSSKAVHNSSHDLEFRFTLEHRSEDKYQLTIVQPTKRAGKDRKRTLNVRVNFSNLAAPRVRLDEGDKDTPYELIQPLYLMEELLKSTFASYTYIGPLREQPLRRYIYDDEVIEVGTKGENAPYIYLAEQDNWLQGHFFYNELSDSFEKRDYLKLGDAVRYWLEQMGIKGFSPQFARDIIYVNLDSGPGRKQKVSIADVGFGVSQIFPIILEGLRMPSHATLLLEQPEIHLHPNLQMRLADYFVCLAKSGKNVVVETHSDHIINRLVRRLLEDSSNDLAKSVGIYFVDNSHSGSKFQPIEVDPLKGIVNWPEGFFDQNATEQELIIRTCLNNRRKHRSK
jgi:predicted ATPase